MMTNSALPSLQSWPSDKLAALEAKLSTELDRRRSRNRLKYYRPYSKQALFHAAGAEVVERLLLAGNQNGKTYCGAAEMAIHASGRYPDWWTGCVFPGAIDAWAAGVTNETTRDIVQKALVGPPELKEAWGTGFIPADAIVEAKPARGIANALDYVVVRHGGGGDVQAQHSYIGFKSYEQGRESWQGPPKDLVWFDEEPPQAVYTEGRARTNTRGRRSIMTFTPLQGMSEVVAGFLLKPPEEIAKIGRRVISMTIHDAEHYTPEEREAIIASYPEHEREARALGVPAVGSGRVFPVTEESIKCDPLPIAKHWVQINGLDFGWDHPFAAVNLAWDRDADIIYVTRAYREAKATPPIHAAAIKPWGEWIPCAWPHDGYQHDKGSGDQLANLYKKQGLKMLPDHATHAEGGNGVEAGIMEILTRMQTGRIKVFSNLGEWWEEFRLYRREKGKVVKERDDLMAATRYAIMMLRFARVETDKRKKRDDEGDEGGAGGSSFWGSN